MGAVSAFDRRVCCLVASLLLLTAAPAAGQVANGRLQLHFMNVGQGDGALLVSPGGETVLFDDGVRNNCTLPESYLEGLGITSVDYHVASHYHDDHIGCAKAILGRFPVKKAAFDRGGVYKSKTFEDYEATVRHKRMTITPGQTLTLDANSPNPVLIQFVAANATVPDGGTATEAGNENDFSVVAVIIFAGFRAEMGGDLSGQDEGDYADVESLVAPSVGLLDLYKVHHHGSAFSSNSAWLNSTRPTVGIVSAGLGNKHHHPTPEAIDALHAIGTMLFWTTTGNGAPVAKGMDTVGGNIVVEVDAAKKSFAVTTGITSPLPTVQTFALKAASGVAPNTPKFAWSKKASVYHLASCRFVGNIAAANLERGAQPPQKKRLHEQCSQ